MTRPDLSPQAACVTTTGDPVDWFDPRKRSKAARACRSCPVLAPCERWASRQTALHGMWAGAWHGPLTLAVDTRNPPKETP